MDAIIYKEYFSFSNELNTISTKNTLEIIKSVLIIALKILSYIMIIFPIICAIGVCIQNYTLKLEEKKKDGPGQTEEPVVPTKRTTTIQELTINVESVPISVKIFSNSANPTPNFDLTEWEDPISNEDFSEHIHNNSVALVYNSKGELFSAKSVAQWLSNIETSTMIYGEEGFCNTVDECKDLFSYLIQNTEDNEVKEKLLKQQEIFTKIVPMLQEFENSNDLIGVLRNLQKNFKREGNVGVDLISTLQEFSLRKYYEIKDCFPDEVKEFVLPGHVFSPEDPFCIATAGKNFLSKIERLATFVTEKTPSTSFDSFDELKEKVEKLLTQLNKKFPDVKSTRVKECGTFSFAAANSYEIKYETLKRPFIFDDFAMAHSFEKYARFYTDSNLMELYIRELLNQPIEFHYKTDLINIQNRFKGNIAGFNRAIKDWLASVVKSNTDELQEKFWDIYTESILRWAYKCEKDHPPSINRLINDKKTLKKILAIYNERCENTKERIILALKESFGNDYPIRKFLNKGKNIKEDQIAFLDCILGLKYDLPVVLEKDFHGELQLKTPMRGASGIECFTEKINGVVKRGLIKLV